MEKTETEIKSTIKAPKNAKFKVYWYDRPENYNRDNRLKIKNDIANKYGVNSDNVKVIFRYSNVDDMGNSIELEDSNIENVLDIDHQKSLFKEWVDREGKNVDFDRLMKLDDTINEEIDYDFEKELNKSWSIKSIEINNFLSFGDGNYLSFDDLINGLTVVSSHPENQGGKTTLCLDAIKFLLFGRTTRTDKNEELFNDTTDNNKMSVKGKVDIDGELFYIERKMTRSFSKNGNVNISNTVNYYRILSDGTNEKMNEEDAKQTQNKINEAVGREKDFESVVIASDKTLDSLIDSTPTENGKLLNRFIGNEPLFDKEKKGREKYNEFSKNMLSNNYDIVNLEEEIKGHREAIENCDAALKTKNQELEKVSEKLKELNNKKDELNSSKKPIDEEIKNLDYDKLKEELEDIKNRGKELKDKKERLEKEINEIGEIDFDEEHYNNKTKEKNDKEVTYNSKLNEAEKIKEWIGKLQNEQICPTCKRPLDEVDHSDEIKSNEEKLNNLNKEIEELSKEISSIKSEIEELNKVKEQVDKKNKLEIEKDKVKADIANLRNSYREKEEKKNKFDENLENIQKNKEIHAEIEKVQSQLDLNEGEKDKLNREIEKINNEKKNNTESIDEKNDLIDRIKKEKEVERLYKVYIEMLGKKGVRKMVLRTVLPKINSELNKLLDDVCDFHVTVEMDHRDEVQLYINRSGKERPLKSGSGFERVAASLALRCVLGKISNLPTPNFVVFDEIFGKVGESNMPLMKDLLDKVTDMYDMVFFITHYNSVKDWADNIVSVVNENNVSKLSLKE